ncbi:unnamed protein product, partial [Closterium sp. NIES-53]
VREQEPTSAELQTEWSIQPGDTGKPTILTSPSPFSFRFSHCTHCCLSYSSPPAVSQCQVSILPGGSVSFEHRNINGLNRSVTGSVSAGNLLSPQDDLVFKLEYVHPYIDGVDDTGRNRVGRVTCFNHRKVSAVFTGGPSLDEVPAIWVDRAGIKATVSENFTRQSRITYGAVIEEVTTRDENTSICTHGFKMLPSGLPTPDGPPTTLSGTGVDRVAFLQANVTRDNTNFVNGTPVGDRTIFQVRKLKEVTSSRGAGAEGPPTTLSGTGVDRVAFLQANVTRDNTNFVNGTPVGDCTIFQVRRLGSRHRS